MYFPLLHYETSGGSYFASVIRRCLNNSEAFRHRRMCIASRIHDAEAGAEQQAKKIECHLERRYYKKKVPERLLISSLSRCLPVFGDELRKDVSMSAYGPVASSYL